MTIAGGAAAVERDLDLDAAFDRETRTGVLIAMAVVALWVAVGLFEFVASALPSHNAAPASFRYPVGMLIFAGTYNALSIVFFAIAFRSRRPLLWCYLSMILDILMLMELKFFWIWMPPILAKLPIFVEVRYLDIGIFFMLATIYLLPMSRALILWTGGLSLALWIAGIVRAFAVFPGGQLFWGPFAGVAQLSAIMKPDILVVDDFVIQIVLFGAFILLLFLAAREGRRFVIARVQAETDRSFLSRFFPPDIVARIGALDGAELAPARHRVAVMFASVPSPASAAEKGFATLEAFFALTEDVVFAHGGMMDRFDGGPAMAVFGALLEDADAARKAMACARALAARYADAGIAAAISLHVGEAVCGEAGGRRSRIFSVVGDVVNASRRILDEALARTLAIVVSDDVLARTGLAADAHDLGDITLRGRETPLHLWAVRA